MLKCGDACTRVGKALWEVPGGAGRSVVCHLLSVSLQVSIIASPVLPRHT